MYFFNLIKSNYQNPTINFTLNGERLNVFTLKIKNKAKMPIGITILQHSIGNSIQCKKARNANNSM